MSGRRSGTGRTGPAYNSRASTGGPNRHYNDGNRYNNTRSNSNYNQQEQQQQNNQQQYPLAQAQARNQNTYNKPVEVKEEIKPEVMPSPQPQRQAPTPVPAPAPVATTPTKVKADEPPAQEPVQKPEAMQEDGGDGDDDKKPWKKNKLNKVKKLSNSERRNRQNKRLRKLLTPKNALMVLNELHGPNVPEFKLGQTVAQAFAQGNQYKAEVVVNGSTYQGQGISKIMAKNNAAEKALRDLVLDRMRKEIVPETTTDEDVEMTEGDEKPNGNAKETQIPMLHLASFALHKLFSEWQAEGYDIPLMSKNLTGSTVNGNDAAAAMKFIGDILNNPKDLAEVQQQPAADAGDGKVDNGPKKLPKMRTELPPNPEALHPAMLLSQMRPGITYCDVSTYDGISPNNGMFTVSVSVDGKDFFGAAKNKKEARRQAAQQACTSLFGVKYPAAEMIVE